MSTNPPRASDLKRTWTWSVKLDRVPVCPTCGEPLHPGAVQIVNALAYCRPCAYIPTADWSELTTAIHDPRLSDVVRYTAGINWYIGPRYGPVVPLLVYAQRIGLDNETPPSRAGQPVRDPQPQQPPTR